MTVAAKRNIFMHARSYLQGQSHVKDIHQRKLLVQSVVEGTRLHQKQGDTVTTLQENVAEQQERRKAEEKELEAQRLLEEAAKEEVVEVLEVEYHAANSTLTSVGFLHSQVAKLETLAKSYKDESLIATAVSSAQNCVSLLMTLKSKISDDEDMLQYIREARFSADELSVSLLHDLQGEIAKMREALQSAKETARAESVQSEQQKDVLQMVGSIYEDMLKLQVSAFGTASGPLGRESEEVEAAETEVPTEQAVPQDAAPAEDAEDATASAAEASETLEALEAVSATAEGPAEEEGAPEQDTSECGGDAGTSTVSTALPALGAFAMQEDAQPDDPQLEDPQPEDPQLEDLHPEAERSELPQLAGSHTADAGKRPSQASEGVKVADAPVPLPKIGSTEVVDSALATAEPQTPRDATMLPCAAAPPATVPEGAVPEGAAAVRKARKKRLIMAPKVRLPPLAALNRKNTGDLDWNMEHLNEAEMKLLTSVLAEDGVHHSQSVVVSPKKERLWKEVWGLEDARHTRFTSAPAPPFPVCPPVPEVLEEAPESTVELVEAVVKPRKVRTLTDLWDWSDWSDWDLRDLRYGSCKKGSVRQRMAQLG